MISHQLNKTGSDPLGRYYTNNLVGRTLIREMNLSSPNLILDLGAGDGALSAEAAQVWTSAQLVTVDIESSISQVNNDLLKSINSRHFRFDALNSQLHHELGLDLASADGAICNPPYIRPHWRKEFAEILEDAGLSGIFSSIKDVGADVLFIAQNLRFLRKSGRLGLILPDGIIAGQKHFKLRQKLFEQHKIERIIELPRKIFRKTDAKAHIMILTKNDSSNETVVVDRMEFDGSFSKQLTVSVDDATQRIDYSYIESQQMVKAQSKTQLSEVYKTLTRGQLSSVQVRESDVNVFHSTDFPQIKSHKPPKVPKDFVLSKLPRESLKTTIAEAGDILVCRVGRNLEGKICYVPKGYVAISDCVYKLNIPLPYRENVLSFLCSVEGREQLKALTHGVGAKFLSKKDFLNLAIAL